MCPYEYYTIMRQSKDPRYIRFKMVMEARKNGVKPTARLFRTSPRTVRKWLERFDDTLESLQDRSRAPKRRPRQLAPEAEEEIVKARKRLPVWGARRLKRDMNLPYSAKAISRVLRERGLVRRWRRKKHEVKRCLREVKRNWHLWQQITADTKELCDIPEYLLQAKAKGLPLHQYTAREVSTGVLFLGFADELSLTYAQLFAERIGQHLKEHGVKMEGVTWQTDNGSEFVGSWQATEESAFTRTVESFGSAHRTIPPGAHRFQADVETVHGIMEREFYLERFRDRRDFIKKAAFYQHYFNYVRLNSAKEEKSPWDLVREKDLTASASLLYLPPVFLDDLFAQRYGAARPLNKEEDHLTGLRHLCGEKTKRARRDTRRISSERARFVKKALIGVHDVWSHPCFCLAVLPAARDKFRVPGNAG